MPPISEEGKVITVTHSGSGYQIGKTFSQDYNFIPASVHAHVGIARVQATTQGPFGAAVGISEATFVGPNGQDIVVNFGQPHEWETALYPSMSVAPGASKIRKFTVSAWVVRGQLKAWSYKQVWA